jgi:hypothetical protein
MSWQSPTVQVARALAERAHADQLRKAGNVPYFTHLDAVARIVAAHGYDDDVTLAAAYLHDLIEDRPAFEAELRACMPREVIETVEVLSEQKADAHGVKRGKAARFDDYCAGLASGTPAALRAMPISAADKIHNAQSLIEADPAERLLFKLSTRPEEHAPQLQRVRAIYAGVISPSLLAAFDQTVSALEASIAAQLAQLRNVYVQLDAESVARARAHARLSVPKAEHVTLGFRLEAHELARVLPAGRALGEAVELRAVSECCDARAQVWVVELDGESHRPDDGGTLHLTVSRAADARSRDANDVLKSAARAPIDVPLTGVIAWED